jgi:hypothetical protein
MDDCDCDVMSVFRSWLEDKILLLFHLYRQVFRCPSYSCTHARMHAPFCRDLPLISLVHPSSSPVSAVLGVYR